MELPSIDGSSPSFSLSNFLNSLITKNAQSRVEIESAIGKLNQTPFCPNARGSRYTRGTRKSNCRLRDRKMDILTIPRHWKKLPETILKPTINTAKFIIRNPFMDIDLSSGSEVKIPTAGPERNTETPQHIRVMRLAHFTDSQYTSRTREYCLAP